MDPSRIRPNKHCFEFKKTGACKFGTGCRYSHESGLIQREQPSPSYRSHAKGFTGTKKQRQTGNGQWQQWKQILQSSGISRPSSQTVGHFFQLTLEILNGDVGVGQEAIKLLVGENGLSVIKDVSDRHIQNANNDQGNTHLWVTQVKPLFQLVTHPRVIDSAVLERESTTIFNFLQGVGGSRMARLFGYITAMVQQLPSDSNISRMETVELSLAVLSKMLDCNTTNIINDYFSTFVLLFSDFLGEPVHPEEEFSRVQASKYLDYMQRRLEIGSEIQDCQTLSRATVSREQFILSRDLPGHLSAGGPRHDNDHAEITNIKILPTYDEIMSPRGEYLPTTDSSQWHISGIRGRLDREFRLVREDTIGLLRDAVHEALNHIRNPNRAQHRHTQNSLRTYTYDFLTLSSSKLDKDCGLELTVCCSQPLAVQKLSPAKRRDWWLQSKRLQAGALVCILDATGSVQFCVVSNATIRHRDNKKHPQQAQATDDQGRAEKAAEAFTLSDHAEYLYVRLELIDAGKEELSQALRLHQKARPTLQQCIVEFPGVLLASFKHTLEALKHLYRRPNVPFRDIISPIEASREVEIQLPLYARKPGFMFDLTCLTVDNTELTMSPRHPLTSTEVASRSSLDDTQAAALINTLTREMSLIQGPPGTGKSYTGEKIIKVLLANKSKSQIGPIMCVCYTNHALDQLLEHLLDDGTQKIIRIGSRSKSERLQDLNLRTVVRAFDRTRSEKSSLYEVQRSLEDIARQLNTLLIELSRAESWRNVKKFLSESSTVHHDELFGKATDGWEAVTHQPENIVGRWLAGGHHSGMPARNIEALRQSPLATMSHAERSTIHNYWLHNIREPINSGIRSSYEEYTVALEHRARIRIDLDLRCLQQADVIGVTTTGFAKNLELLRRLRCKVLLCEEAGEVLEAHILTALLPSLEHTILIGDHLQLRPQIQNYELQSTSPRGSQYSLDTSLFERLVQPANISDPTIPFSILETQRRMHPSISKLIRSTLYSDLKDAKQVMTYPKVVGLKQRLFWLHHGNLEAGAASQDPLNTSHVNDFEVEMAAALVSHLFRQAEYSQGDIAVITPYLGQLQKLRRRMESMFEICVNDRDLEELEALETDTHLTNMSPRSLLKRSTLLNSVRVATVDNFQGEEAKVVVISLVRSNHQNKCGFLSTSNRINVLLSRAQHGMYIIGNADTCQNVPMWAEVIDMLQASSCFGRSLELQCPRHPEAPLRVSQPDHFLQFSPESGCNLRCDKRLHCGHSCTGRCHSDLLHSAVKCLEKCPRPFMGCEHPCPLPCGEPCREKCHVRLDNIDLTLACGHHLSTAKCWETQDPASIRCRKQVVRTIPGCNHELKVECHEKITADDYRCTAECRLHRHCGHTCRSPCFRCRKREVGVVVSENHGICEVRCGRKYSSCSHSCTSACHGESKCPPCSEPCEVRCGHSKCGKPCHEPCAPCAEKTCQSQCPHTQCTMPCAAPCDWVPCSKRCGKSLECGHQCPSLCGEACPGSTHCQQCGSEDVKSACVDFLEMKEYREIDLNEEPCIFPDCGHFLTISSMDGQMDMVSHYELDENGLPTKILKASEPLSMEDLSIKVCANCRAPLRNISRYGRIVRRAMLDRATKKFITWSNSNYEALAERLLVEQEKLDGLPANQLHPTPVQGTRSKFSVPRLRQLLVLQDAVGNTRYGGIITLWRSIHAYKLQVRQEEQPFQRVADLVLHAIRQHETKQPFLYDESIVQLKGRLVASVLLLKCEIIVFSDFVRHCSKQIVRAEVKLDLSAQNSECIRLIELAQRTSHPKEEVQGNIISAQLRWLSVAFGTTSPVREGEGCDGENGATKRLKKEGLSYLTKARNLLLMYPSTAFLESEIEATESMINGGIYRPVSADELRAVYKAMAGELRGTGHWYTCVHGHPFAIADCGMPMEEARCPECGARIGGHNHVPVQGVRRAEELEEIARGVDRLDL